MSRSVTRVWTSALYVVVEIKKRRIPVGTMRQGSSTHLEPVLRILIATKREDEDSEEGDDGEGWIRVGYRHLSIFCSPNYRLHSWIF